MGNGNNRQFHPATFRGDTKMDTQLTPLTFEVKNLGSVKYGQFTHKPLTIFYGENNTGKTWTIYALYTFYKLLPIIAATLEEIPEDTVESWRSSVNEYLPYTFNVSRALLGTAEFNLSPDHDFGRLIAEGQFPDIFLMPAERNGLHLFYRELRRRRTGLLHRASREGINLEDLLRDVVDSRYAEPIADYIDWLNRLSEIEPAGQPTFHSLAERVKRYLAGGAYGIDPRTDSIQFRPYRTREDTRSTRRIPLHATSSAVKSLFALWFYLESQALPGNILMIDEPELNLHPSSQRTIARLLARLVNAGVHVVISTHSDYIVREFNSLIMLNHEDAFRFRRKYRYHDDEILDPELVGTYVFKDQTIEPSDITAHDGIRADTFDSVIEQINAVNNDIYYGIQERRDGK